MPNLWRIFWILAGVAFLATLLTFLGVWVFTGDLDQANQRAAWMLKIVGIWPAICAGAALSIKKPPKAPGGKTEEPHEDPESPK